MYSRFETQSEAKDERAQLQRALATQLGVPCWDPVADNPAHKNFALGLLGRQTIWNAGESIVTILSVSAVSGTPEAWQVTISSGPPPKMIDLDAASEELWRQSSCLKHTDGERSAARP